MKKTFKHRALELQNRKTIVFTALSKKYFYMRVLISKFVFEKDCVPLNPFTTFDYFLHDLVDRDKIRNANNNLVAIADELWVFGSISDGVYAEIKQSKDQDKPIRYFTIRNDKEIVEISENDLEYEEDIKKVI